MVVVSGQTARAIMVNPRTRLVKVVKVCCCYLGHHCNPLSGFSARGDATCELRYSSSLVSDAGSANGALVVDVEAWLGQSKRFQIL